MLFRRFYDENLAQASYMIACEQTREAVVVDPNLDVAQYVRAAGADRVRIAHVTETYIHADFVSGAKALAEAAGATLHLSAEGDAEWGYSESALAGADALGDGCAISFGLVRLTAAHTPGHTPEHVSFFVSDLERGDAAVGALTGDFVFVGDVGRPDLLERTAGARGSMESSASELFRSIRDFKSRADHLQIWPGHGAGSACGKSLGSMPQSTLGYEKLFNWAFVDMSEAQFVARVLQDQPVPPRYFALMKRINRDAEIPGETVPVEPLGIEELESVLRDRAPVVDVRMAARFAEGHVPGTLNIPRNKSFLNWCGALIPGDRDFYLITDADSAEAVKLVQLDLRKVGLSRLRGYFGRDVLHEWKSRHGEMETVQQLDTQQLRKLTDKSEVQLVDVRGPDEWRRGHLPGAIHIPLASLPERMEELDPSMPVVLQCRGGGRSSIATSLLQSHGITNASNLAGGYESWVKSGFNVETDE
jgi:hydroxyacylglutathione hydrolase